MAAPLVAYPALVSEREPVVLWTVGGAAVVMTVVGMAAGLAAPIVAAVAALAIAYGVSADELGAALDTRAVVYGAGLLFFAELAFLGVEVRTSVLEGGDLVARRLGTILGLLVGAVFVSALLLAIATVEPPGGLLVQVTGVIAAAGALALVMSLARR
ncbi:MAG: hypothetical protein ICV59_07725 [Thermoleophilia bacterium]|nr:hypothetical protein [Thermoleophilia bacterium]